MHCLRVHRFGNAASRVAVLNGTVIVRGGDGPAGGAEAARVPGGNMYVLRAAAEVDAALFPLLEASSASAEVATPVASLDASS